MFETEFAFARGVAGAAAIAAIALLCAAPASATPRCAGKRATLVGTSGNDRLIVHGPGTQVIAGLGGNDKIVSKGGADSVCGGPGNDTINLGPGHDRGYGGAGDDALIGGFRPDILLGGSGNDDLSGGGGSDEIEGTDGNDSVDGGDGRDKILGGNGDDRIDGAGGADLSLSGEAGNDEILGGPGSDLLDGGTGADRLVGGLQDDSLVGGPLRGDGNDLLDGGHGIDEMDGRSGDDWLRGGVNGDQYVGSSGDDTASFAAATPPGPPNHSNGGVDVTLTRTPVGSIGTATGDESASDALSGIENIVGSPFDDSIAAGPGISGSVAGGGGTDDCSGFQQQSCSNAGPGGEATAYVAGAAGPDPGLVLLGGTASFSGQPDNWTVTPVSGGVRVDFPAGQSAPPVDPGDGCSPANAPGRILCQTGPLIRLGYLVAWGGDGNDSITVRDGFSPSTYVSLDGGPGNDVITGGSTGELLIAGSGANGGSDQLNGNGGDDALFARGADPDTLNGGEGNDQFVVDDACGGHTLNGGPGDADIAGFGAESYGVDARLSLHATRLGFAGPCTPTAISPDTELLEGSNHNDILYGDDRSNPLILARDGDDEVHGGGGDDYLRGMAGDDRLFGDAGADTLLGEGGGDVLHAVDHGRDVEIDCGPGGSAASRDSIDPAAIGC